MESKKALLQQNIQCTLGDVKIMTFDLNCGIKDPE